MAVIDRPPPRTKVGLREQIERLKPGDVFSIDRPITVEEFCEYVRDEGKAELVNGVIYLMSPPSDGHEGVAAWLLTILHAFVDARRLGRVRGSRSGVKISGTSLREPDLLFFASSRLDQMTERGVHGAPDLAIEVVESRAARRDAVQKQAQYEEIGVAELWIIDLPRREARQYVLEEARYQRVPAEADGRIVSRTVDGFSLRVEWLFQYPDFPSSLEVVTRLLEDA